MYKQKEKQTVKLFRSLCFFCGKLMILICEFLHNKKNIYKKLEIKTNIHLDGYCFKYNQKNFNTMI